MFEAPWRTSPPRRVVIGARAHEQLTQYIGERRPELQLRGAAHVEVTAQDLEWGEAYLGFKRPPVPGWGNVRWVHCTGAGVDAYLFDDKLPDNILLTRTSEPFGPQIAEYAVSRVLAFTQSLRPFEHQQREHSWKQHFIGTLAGSHVLVVGTGEVGTAVASRFVGMGCKVSGVSRSGTARPGFESVMPTEKLSDAVAEAQFIVLTLPLTADTFHLMNRVVLSRCRGAVLVNVGRGQVVDEAVLPEALDSGWLKGAALDVFETEPLPASSPLWDRADVMISPHVAGLTTIPGAADSFLESLASIERGERPVGLVDRGRGY
ncbi:MAG: D-2-hydroxyacid dehydrogenase [Gemmatimonadaceae bacterium]